MAQVEVQEGVQGQEWGQRKGGQPECLDAGLASRQAQVCYAPGAVRPLGLATVRGADVYCVKRAGCYFGLGPLGSRLCHE